MSETVLLNNQIGMDSKTYLELFTKQADKPNIQGELATKKYEALKLNFQRTSRLEKYFIPSNELISLVNSIEHPQTWIIITELWCGDSAQSIPIITKAALLNDKINLRIILRDENPEIMDQYLTNGSRSVPKLIVFDDKNNELFQWGPRPTEAQNLFQKLKSENLERSEINKQLQLWYGRNRGKDVEKELIELLEKQM
jgi:hypothetical protein